MYYHFSSSLYTKHPLGLQKQTNPNWRAYLFLTDDRPFSDRLREIVLGARDSRVVYFDIDETHRPAVSLQLCCLLCLCIFDKIIFSSVALWHYMKA